MRRLRVRDPDTLTRVTEFVPEIVAFVEGIVKNGYGYAVDGSVYFDTRAFDKADGHDYAKLEPWSKGNWELLEEGEGMPAVFHAYIPLGNLTDSNAQVLCPSPRGVDRPQTSHSGRRQSLASLPGRLSGVRGDQDGTSNAQLWRLRSSARTWISTRAASTLRSRIMIMKWRSQRYLR